MNSHRRAPLAALVVAAGSLLVVATPPTAAYAVPDGEAQAAPGHPGRPADPGNHGKPAKPGKPAQAAKAAPKPNKPHPAKASKPGKPNRPAKPKPKPDHRAPAAPSVGTAWAGAGGAVSIPVSAESGSLVVVREIGGGVVASGTGSQTYRWSTSSGSHSYLVTATDQAGNPSTATTLTYSATR